jgi:hypothetical protein
VRVTIADSELAIARGDVEAAIKKVSTARWQNKGSELVDRHVAMHGFPCL